MVSYLQVEGISKAYGDLQLFEDISFSILKDQKVALVAKNGTGKTTLLRIISGFEKQDYGDITYKNDIQLAYLPQEPNIPNDITILEYVFKSSDKVARAIQKYEHALNSGDEKKLAEAIENMDQAKAWDYDVKAKQILSKLKINDFNRKAGDLSGGEKKRVALANVLIHEPDFLILDEPTNHLDLTMVEWLEEYLKNTRLTLFMVTHDRYFLDRVCNEIIEIDNSNVYRYKGNYSYFLQKREERINEQEARIEKAKNQLRKEEDWVKRAPKARGTKAKYRVDNYYKLKEEASQKSEKDDLKVDFEAKRLGKKIINLKGVSKTLDNNILVKDFSYKFGRFEKVGIVGPNGCGKTTLLNLLAGSLNPDKGEIEAGETVKVGYYRQQGIQFDEEQTVIDTVKKVADVVDLGDGRVFSAKQFLLYFLFDSNKHYMKVEKLSGGEKRRLYLLTVLMQQPNFLLLDEPTNDLDIMTLNVLEQYLSGFKGCVVIVSHDRYFMDQIVDHTFVFLEDGKIKDFPGNYSQYREKIREAYETNLKTQKETKPKDKSKRTKKKSVSYKEKMEFKELEKEISELEAEKNDVEKKVSSGNLSNDELVEKSNKIGVLMKEIDEKTERWMELSEKIEGNE
jgi:ATP-binding cassette subfamily F protein uup